MALSAMSAQEAPGPQHNKAFRRGGAAFLSGTQTLPISQGLQVKGLHVKVSFECLCVCVCVCVFVFVCVCLCISLNAHTHVAFV